MIKNLLERFGMQLATVAQSERFMYLVAQWISRKSGLWL
jgi:hypothetical protein